MTHATGAFFYRPIVLDKPQRIVAPTSWVEHIPFAFWLVDVLRPAVTVELGTHSGNSYAALAQALATLHIPAKAYAVDTWRGDAQAGFYDESVFEEWSAYHDRHFASFSRLLRMPFSEAAPQFADRTIDLLHIDGLHTYEAVTRDFNEWLPKVSDGGVVLFHDTNVRAGDFGVWRLFEEIRPHYRNFQFVHGHGLGMLAVGSGHPEPLEWLFSLEAPEAIFEVRQFFARLGRGVLLEHEHREVRRECSAHLVRHEAERTSLLQQLTTAGTEIERTRGEAAAAQQRAGAEASLRQEVEGVVARASADLQRALQLVERRGYIVNELQALLGKEMARRHEAEARLRQRDAERQPPETAAPRVRALRSVPLRLLVHPEHLRDALTISRSGLFDAAYYRQQYADVAASRLSPLAHYVLHGAREGRRTHPLFDGAYYLRRNPDVALARVNPLAHYARRGAFEGRNPSALFDVPFYLRTNPDVAMRGLDPLQHFLEAGAAEGRRPNPLFDCEYYRQHHPDVGDANPLVHFAAGGWRDLRPPSPDFDPRAYRERYPDVRDDDVNPLAHFLEYGSPAGRDGTAEAQPRGRGPGEKAADLQLSADELPIQLRVRSLHPAPTPDRLPVLCITPFAPLADRGGDEYRVWATAQWLKSRGYPVVPIVAPPPGVVLDDQVLTSLFREYDNAVICDRSGEVRYELRDVPNVLCTLDGGFTGPWLLDERGAAALIDGTGSMSGRDDAACHDVLAATVLRLRSAIGRCVALIESAAMAPLCPLLGSNTWRIVDLLTPGVGELPVSALSQSAGLDDADALIAMNEEQSLQMRQLFPAKPVVVLGVQCAWAPAAMPSTHTVLCAAAPTAENRAALEQFLAFAWPRIRLTVADADLVLAGALGDGFEQVPGVRTVTSADRAALYSLARVSISPARGDHGIRREAIDALAHGCPVVTYASGCFSPAAPQLGRLCLVAGDWFEFARTVAQVLTADGEHRLPADAAGLSQDPAATDVYAPLVRLLNEIPKATAAAQR